MKAKQTQLSRDLFWSIAILNGGAHLRWRGYNDHYWWSNYTDQWCVRQGYRLDPITNEVTKC